MDNDPAMLESNVLKLQAQLRDVLSVNEVQVLQAPDRVVSFKGRLLRDAESAYATVRERFNALGYTPFLQRRGADEVVVAQQGVATAQPMRVWVNVALFAATVLSTLLFGTLYELSAMVEPEMLIQAILAQPILLLAGWRYSLALMSILLAHEMGHYIVGRQYNAPVSLPYFIPMPFLGPFGTMGAVIVQRAPFENRRSLFDIGVAGPLAGLVVALPLLVLGLATSTVGPIPPGGLLEGNSILYLAIKYLIFGRILPGNGVDVTLNAVAWAAWGGLLVTSLNLLPIGQLDGGHILYTLFGRRAWTVAVLASRVLLLIGSLGLAGEFFNIPVLAQNFWPGWFIWGVLTIWMRPQHPPPLNDMAPLGLRRTLVGIGVLVLFVLTFTPMPLTQIG